MTRIYGLGQSHDVSNMNARKEDWPLPHLVIEPGRFTVARAGVALYSIGSQKQTPDGQHIIAVDGGIADNPA